MATFTDLVVASRPETTLPANLDVDPMFQAVVQGMCQRSPAFRRQVARIGAAGTLRVRLLPDDQPRPTQVSHARTTIHFEAGFPVSAEVYLRLTPQISRFIGHEMEHLLEQLDGVDLRAQDGNGVVWKSGDASFETRRAIEAGLRVEQEVAGNTRRPMPDGGGAAQGARLSIAQRDRDAGPLSGRSARISADGRFVALISLARLVEQDRNGLRDVYVFDSETGQLSLETSGPRGEPADGESHTVDISADGRFVAFASEAGNLTAAPFAPGTAHIYLRDRVNGTTRLLSAGAGGHPANGPSRSPAIDSTGTSVAFESAATDLDAAGRGNGIFLANVASGAISRIDQPVDGQARPGASLSPAISADGQYVVFASKANLTCQARSRCADDNGVADIYLRDTRTNTTTRISRSGNGGEADGPSYDPVISGNGKHVAFVSEATNLTHDTVRRGAQIYVHDLRSGKTELVTRTRGGHPGNGSSMRPALSHDGERIAYQSLAPDLLCDRKCKPGQADINLLWDVYVHDRRTGETLRASRDTAGDWMEYSRAPSLDASGRIVVFVTRHPTGDGDDGHDEDVIIATFALRATAGRGVGI
jgi:Tol biopolymer transport system component